MRAKRFEITADLSESSPLPPAKGLHFDQYKITANGREHDMVLLDHAIYGRIIHYWSRRTFPCLRPHEPCPICAAGGEHLVRWEGYASVKVRDLKPVYWLRVSPGLARSVPELADKGVELRGARLMVKREGEGDRGQLKGRITLGYHPANRLPNAIDLPRFMKQQWESAGPERVQADGELPPGVPF